MFKSRRFALLSLFAFSLVGSTSFGQLDQLLGKFRGTAATPTKKIAYFHLKGPIAETPVNMPPLFGDEPPPSMHDILERLKAARSDNNVVGVVFDLQDAQLGAGQLEELHAAMRKFAAVDKPVLVHADSLTTMTYAAATGASHISVVPTGDIWLTGLFGESPYVRGMLDKMGCTPDFEHCGDYKTAAEIIMRTEPSKESKEMTNWLLDSIYDNLVKLIADSRGMTPDKVKGLIDNGPYSAEEAAKLGLIDSVKHRQDFASEIRKKYGDEIEIDRDYGSDKETELPEDPFAMFSFLMQMMNPAPTTYDDPTIAVIYVEGPIQTGSAEAGLFGSSSGAFSTTIRKALDKAAEEDAVKAVVLRVDSPGGSALASEIILHATRRVKAKKPLIVSMGNVAGSGGYYVTCASDAVFADAMTITASIGVVGGKIVTTGGWNKLGINWHSNKRGEMAGIMSSAAPWSDKERAKINHYMNTVYDIFKGHVTAARKDKLKKPIDQLAAGRVFTGAQALELGLVDKIGGFEDAIKFAAQKASLGEYDIRVIPEPPSIFDLFSPHKDGDELATMNLTTKPKSLRNSELVQSVLPMLSTLDPFRVRSILGIMERLELVNREGVAVVMPGELIIR